MSEKTELRLRDVNLDNKAGTTETNHTTNVIEDEPASGEKHGISKLQESCTSCCIPCLTSHNPLPEYPTLLQRLKHGCMLPPHGNLASYIQFAVVCLQVWIVLYTLTHAQALPGGNFFSLLILFICCAIGGYLISFARLPPLLGMLIVGVMLRNIPVISVIGEDINSKWSGSLRKLALTVILTRAGLGLDIVKLKKLSWAVLRLAFIPSTAEIVTVGVVSHLLLGFPWKWSLMLGCIIGALSPAVTVPSLVNLQDRRYGVVKGIPTMLLAAGGLDNVLCVTGFSVFMGVIFSEGDLAVTIIKGPLGVLVGIVYGFVMGIFLWYIPAKDCANKTFYQAMLLFGSGMIAIFGSSEVGLSGAGPLGCLTTATVAAYKWRQRRLPGETDELAGVMALAWLIVQHFLFGLIGAAVTLSKIQSSTAGLAIATLAIGLAVRSVFSFTVTFGTGFNLKERIFIVMTWLSKATVQAAIGGLALDKVMESDTPDEDDLKLATDILTISVLAIVICAPVGATLMAVLGPKFLAKGDEEEAAIMIVTDGKLDKVAPAELTESSPSSNTEMSNGTYKSELSMNLSTPYQNGTAVHLVNQEETNREPDGVVNPAFDNSEPAIKESGSETEVENQPDVKSEETDKEDTTTNAEEEEVKTEQDTNQTTENMNEGETFSQNKNTLESISDSPNSANNDLELSVNSTNSQNDTVADGKYKTIVEVMNTKNTENSTQNTSKSEAEQEYANLNNNAS